MDKKQHFFSPAHVFSKSFLALLITMAGSLPVVAAPDFKREVQPILEGACVRCHGPEKVRGDLKLHTREDMLKGGDEFGPAIVPNRPDQSPLIELVSVDHDHEQIMPAKGEPLSRREIHVLTEWIESGAEWPEGVELVQRERVTDAVKDNKYVVLEKIGATKKPASVQLDDLLSFDNEGREPAVGEALSDLAFLRKVTVDLVGRIPTLDEIMRFNKWSTVERRGNAVEALMEEDRFADRWTIFYADLLRVRTNQAGGKELLAYIHKTIKDEKPWDEFVRELIGQNGRPVDHPAVGFTLAEDADPLEMAAVTAQTFMGVRLGCAMCHNHPFDEWDQKQFYEMASFFGKTKKIESNFGRPLIYTTEGKDMNVLWPPEREKPPSRSPVSPKFPFQLEAYDKAPPHIERYTKKRDEAHAAQAQAVVANLDDLLDIETKAEKGFGGFDITASVKGDKDSIDIEGDLYKRSDLKEQLAELITKPTNRYFSRAFVNRVWSEFMGRGFFNPVDNFTDISQVSHPTAMDHLADEFVASGFDLKNLIRVIVHTKAYQRGALDASVADEVLRASHDAFTATPSRRMLSEVLYDSVIQAGHLFEYKWPKGANVRTIERQIKVSLDDEEEVQAAARERAEQAGQEAMMASQAMAAKAKSTKKMANKMAKNGYSLEGSIELDFGALLDQKKDTKQELAMMKQMADEQLKQNMMRQAMMERRNRPRRYTYETVEETIDDNPKYSTSMRMATPAPPAHFLRVFGQTARDTLGEFRDQGPSMRQALMMLNGKATYEAARVGSFEQLYTLLDPAKPQLEKAIKIVYLECLTRLPSRGELRDGLEVLNAYGHEGDAYREGMADLRWALLNCHEFRYLP